MVSLFENRFVEMIVNKKKRYILYLTPTILYACLIFSASAIPRFDQELYFILKFDKLLHTIEYYMLGYLLMRMFVTSPSMTISRYSVIFSLSIGLLYGLSDEWHQSFVPGRCASLIDGIFDFVGVAIAALTFELVRYSLPVVHNIEERIEYF